MVRKMWLVWFQLWFLCFATVNFHQVERGFAEAGVITVSNSQWKIGKVVDVDGSREIGFLGRKTMVHALSREDEGLMEKTRRRIPEENKDSEKFNPRFADHFNNGIERTGLKSKSLSKMAEKPILYTRKTRREEDKEEEEEGERLMEEAEKIAKLIHNDYGESSHLSPPVNNHHPYQLQETSKP